MCYGGGVGSDTPWEFGSLEEAREFYNDIIQGSDMAEAFCDILLEDGDKPSLLCVSVTLLEYDGDEPTEIDSEYFGITNFIQALDDNMDNFNYRELYDRCLAERWGEDVADYLRSRGKKASAANLESFHVELNDRMWHRFKSTNPDNPDPNPSCDVNERAMDEAFVKVFGDAYAPKNEAKFRLLREMMGLTQSDIANEFDVTITTVKRWERPDMPYPIPDDVWSWVERAYAGFNASAKAWSNKLIDAMDTHGRDSAYVYIYRSQAQLDEARNAPADRYTASVGYVNALTREVYRICTEQGHTIDVAYHDQYEFVETF
jgi:transcriptional regulator with XRE-family HTH domain